ncbi:hypothetical protein RQP46_011491 [Phenoliferia psychrophenolica]
MSAPLTTEFTKLFGVRHPVMNAGMDVVAGPALAAAVTNAGGLGIFGGVHYSPRMMREKLEELKEGLNDENAPFGVDLALPQIGGNARKTNKDYTKGNLDELIDVIIEFKPVLFISAVGVPPKHIVEKLHRAGVVVMNMIGHPKHIVKALEVGCDMVCAQGGEAGGHTGEIPFSILIPAAVKAVRGKVSPLTGRPVQVIAAGAVHSGASLAAALSYGASAVWVGTGRPLRARATPLVKDWEENRQSEIRDMVSKGIVPVGLDDPDVRPYLMGKVSAMVSEIQPAKQIVEEMVSEAVEIIKHNTSYLQADVRAKL